MPRLTLIHMKKITIYFKSGNMMRFKCKTFEFTIDKNSDKRELKMTNVDMEQWMIDLSEIEAFTIRKCLF